MKRYLKEKSGSCVFKLVVCISICAIVSTGFSGLISAQSEDAFISSVKVFGSDYGDDAFNGVCVSSDGTLLSYGSAAGLGDRGDLLGIRKGTINDTDALIVKYSNDNSVIWKQCFGGTGQDHFSDAIQASDGNYILVGSTSSVDMDLTGIRKHESYLADALIVKYDTDGNILWANTFGGEAVDVFESITQTSDGNIIVAGYSYSTTLDMTGKHIGGKDAIVVKYNQDGSPIWVKSLGGAQYDTFRKVTSDGEGGVVVVGHSRSEDGDFSPRHGPGLDVDAIMARYDADGNRMWLNVFGGISVDDFYDVCLTPDGGFVAVGYTGSRDYDMVGNTMSGYNGLVAKFDSFGNLIWKEFVGGSRQDYLRGICTLDNGGFAVVGSTLSNDYDFEGMRKQTLGNAYEASIVKLSNEGATVWSKTFGGINGRGVQEDRFFGVAQLSNGQIVATGHTASKDGDLAGLRYPSSYNNKDAVLVKYTMQPYTVKFMDGSDIYTRRQVYDGETIGSTNWPDNPEKERYNFLGWYTEQDGAGTQLTMETIINENITVYANWEPAYCSITFDPQGGTVSTEQHTVFFGEVYGELPIPEKVGYTFDGWYTQPDGEGELIIDSTIVSTESDHTLYAKWIINTYIVTFEDWDGTVLDEQIIEYGSAATAPNAPTRTGYAFTGWDAVFKNVVSNLIVTAQYTAKTYTLMFDSIDGEVLPESVPVIYDTVYGELPVPVLEDYVFNGWYTQVDGAGELITEESIVCIANDHTLYAYWVPFVGIKNIKLIAPDNIGVGFTSEIEVSINPTDASIQLLNWVSSDVDIAVVDSNGMVTGIREGKVTITVYATDGSGKKDSVKINIITFAESIMIYGPAEVEAGSSINLDVIISPSETSESKVEWSSSDTSVAMVTPSGVVNAAEIVKNDTAVIIRATAKDGSGSYGEYVLIVKANSVN